MMISSTCPDATCGYRNSLGYCTITSCVCQYNDSTSSVERLRAAVKQSEEWMKHAPYLCYDLAKELIEAAKGVVEDKRV